MENIVLKVFWRYQLKKKYYTIQYPFEKSVFDQKFIARTIPFQIMARINLSYDSKIMNGRKFFGELVNDRFQIYTCPDMFDAALTPWLLIQRMSALFSFSRIYGIVHESDGQLVVECTTDKMELAKLIAVLAVFMSTVTVLGCGIGFGIEGFDFGKLLALIMVPFMAIPSFFALRHHQGEEDALIKFMEDLEN